MDFRGVSQIKNKRKQTLHFVRWVSDTEKTHYTFPFPSVEPPADRPTALWPMCSGYSRLMK